MSIIDSLGLTYQTVGSVIGTIRTEGRFRNKDYTQEELDSLIQEAIERGWRVPTEKQQNAVDIDSLLQDFSNPATDDTALASLYLYKVQNAKDRGIAFTLTLNDLRRLCKRATCYYTGQRFISESKSPRKPTLDRKDSKIGYTKENTVMCCYWVNKVKGMLFENESSAIHTDVKTMMKLLKKMEN